MTFRLRLECQGVSSAKTQRKSLLDRRIRKCKGPEAAVGMVILKNSKEATMVEESYESVGSCRLPGKDTEFHSDCDGKLWEGIKQR